MHIKDIQDLFWAPTRVTAPFPSTATFHPAPVVAYHSLNGALLLAKVLAVQLSEAGLRLTQGCPADFLGNFGHVLYDFLFPVFNMLQILGLYTPDFQLVFARLQVQACLVSGSSKQHFGQFDGLYCEFELSASISKASLARL